jgi:hypothetical protein
MVRFAKCETEYGRKSFEGGPAKKLVQNPEFNRQNHGEGIRQRTTQHKQKMFKPEPTSAPGRGSCAAIENDGEKAPAKPEPQKLNQQAVSTEFKREYAETNQPGRQDMSQFMDEDCHQNTQSKPGYV